MSLRIDTKQNMFKKIISPFSFFSIFTYPGVSCPVLSTCMFSRGLLQPPCVTWFHPNGPFSRTYFSIFFFISLRFSSYTSFSWLNTLINALIKIFSLFLLFSFAPYWCEFSFILNTVAHFDLPTTFLNASYFIHHFNFQFPRVPFSQFFSVDCFLQPAWFPFLVFFNSSWPVFNVCSLRSPFCFQCWIFFCQSFIRVLQLFFSIFSCSLSRFLRVIIFFCSSFMIFFIFFVFSVIHSSVSLFSHFS